VSDLDRAAVLSALDAALKGTGREPLTGEDRLALGPSAGKFPLFA
jgi:hypothetical protein